MQGGATHPLNKHVERIIGRQSEVPDFVGATLAEQRFVDWIKGGRRREDWMGVFREIQREPVTSVLVVLARENAQSRKVVDEILNKVPHSIMLWGEGGIFPGIRLPKRD